MAISHNVLRFQQIGGLDQVWKGKPGFADDITNARVDPAGQGWLHDRGLEPWWSFPASQNIDTSTDNITTFLGSKADSVFVWATQNIEQVYYFVEANGVLYYQWGAKGSTLASIWDNDFIILAKGRHIPKQNDTGTQFIPYGNRLLIINGYDAPIWFYGRERQRDFSFTLPTPSPEILDVQINYYEGQSLENGVAHPNFITNSHRGLGVVGQRTHYEYKVSFISDTGSESPLSVAASVDWITTGTAATQKRYGVFIKDLPIGPDGTVARRIYRTKNQKYDGEATAGNAEYYLVNQINDNTSTIYADTLPDSQLVNLAPSATSSQVITSSYITGTTWQGRIWLGGGSANPTKVIYSERGLPEQFGVFSYFDFGNTIGGPITAIYPYYNNLLVFRQNSIDVIRILADGTFTSSQLTPHIGTTAINTIRLVPGTGVMFLSYDGLYVITGGLDGGSVVQVQNVADPVSRELERINIASIHRSHAVYSHKEREYWVHYPVGSDVLPSRGIVFHMDTKQFSLRHVQNENFKKYFYFTSSTTDPEGNIIFGTKPTWVNAIGNEVTPLTLNAKGILVGLQVWSGSPTWGQQLTLSAISQGIYTYDSADLTHPQSVWESNWLDFGNNAIKHRIFSVEAEIVSYGDNGITLDYAKDYNYTFDTAGSQKQNKPETIFTSKEDPVFGANDGNSKNYFTIGTSTLQDGRITRLRWDCNTELITNFKFRLSTTNGAPFHLISFSINYDNREQMTLNQNINLGKGQPR